MKNETSMVADPARMGPEADLPGLLLKQPPSQKSFKIYLFGENKIYSLLMISLMIIQFFIFKLFYPFPDFFSDSYSYLFAAYAHLDVNIWPIGYSKFLDIFHWFTHSATALNFFQYIFLGLSSLYLYHTIIYFYHTGKNTRITLCFFLFFNPLNLYLANYVSSDAIFVGLSLIWLSQLIWIINRMKVYFILVQAILILIAFTFRYNAMYYPILTALALIFSKQKTWIKIMGSILAPALFIPFILFSLVASKEMIGSAQFPPILGGWQWGNNAHYMREFIDVDSTKFPTPETAELDQIARNYFRSVPPEYRDLSNYVANFFIRQPEAPLKRYLVSHYKIGSEKEQVIAWGKVAPIFGRYGIYLIEGHPLAFARYYLLVNTKNYFLPPLEKLEIYNLGMDKISSIAAYWFHFPNVYITSSSKTLQGSLLFLYPSLFMFLNLYFVWNIFNLFRNKGFRKNRHFFATSLFIISFMILNFFFSVLANIIVIRYQVFPMIVCLSFSMVFTDYLELNKTQNRKAVLTQSLQNKPIESSNII